MTIKLTYEYVKSNIENTGYQLLSTKYKDVKTKLQLKCPENHFIEINYNKFQSGRRCAICNKGIRLTYEYVKSWIENPDLGGYKLLSTEYINAKTKLEIECPNEHVFEINYDNFKQGKRCAECSGIKKYIFEEVKEHIDNEGYKLLSTEYINNISILKIKCPLGHICDKTFGNFMRGQRCSECIGNKKFTIEEVKKYIENEESYKLLSTEYKCNKEKLQFECPNNHIFDMSFHKFKNANRRCPVCKNKTEAKLHDWFKSQYEVTYQPKYEWCKKKQELPYDFSIEEYKILIELDGDQHFKDIESWNSDYKEVQANDKFKMLKALQNGYTIIRIYQPDVLNDTIDWKTIIQELITLRDEWCLMYVSSKDIYDDENCDFNFNLAKNDITELEVDEIIDKIDDFHLEEEVGINESSSQEDSLEEDNDTKTIKIEDFKNKIENIKSILIKEEKNYICYFKGRVSL